MLDATRAYTYVVYHVFCNLIACGAALTGWLIQVHAHACTALLKTTQALSQAGTRELNATIQV